MKKSYVAALDLGDSFIRLAVASSNTDGAITLEALVESPSEGVRRGKIENVAQVTAIIKSLLQQMQSEHMFRVDSMHVGLSGQYVRCAYHGDHVFVQDSPSGVSGSDVALLADRMRSVQAPEGEVIIDRFAQNYLVDGTKEVKNPVGSFGRKLTSTYNFVLCENEHAKRVRLALGNSGVSLNRIHSNALSICQAVTTEDESGDGVVIVDVGSQLTNVTICRNNVVRYISSIPIGADAMDEDLRSMAVPSRHVRSVKHSAGNAISAEVPKSEFVKVHGRAQGEFQSVSVHNVAIVVEARATEIAEFVREEIENAGFEGSIPYMVLTGGAAHIRNFDQLLKKVTGLDTRISSPINKFDLAALDKLHDPSFSSIAGVLIHSISQPSDVQRLFVSEPEPVEPEPIEPIEQDNGEGFVKVVKDRLVNWFNNISRDGEDMA